MNKDILDLYFDIYTLEHTKRYSMKPVIKQESVASHSFFVSVGVLLLSEVYEFDVDRALKMALCHDLTEMFISDINHHVKKSFPVLAHAIKQTEADTARLLPLSLQVPLLEYDQSSVEAWVVHLADALQCLQYANSEISLGNRAYMIEVKDNSEARIKKLEEKLEQFLKGR